MSVNIGCNLSSTSLPSNYMSVKLRDDARNSSNDKLFQIHHPKSRNLEAVTVHFLLSTQISPVNCKRGSEERLSFPDTAEMWSFLSRARQRCLCRYTDSLPHPFEVRTSWIAAPYENIDMWLTEEGNQQLLGWQDYSKGVWPGCGRWFSPSITLLHFLYPQHKKDMGLLEQVQRRIMKLIRGLREFPLQGQAERIAAAQPGEE